jgi:[acyl-carrier-protein] S-malonyltransferase
MAAILGLSSEEVAQACRDASEGQVVEPANLNGASQTVIAGHRQAVERAGALAQQRGAKRVISLAVSAPFHCSLMAPAAEALARDLAVVEFADLAVPLFANVDARPITRGGEARQALIRQVDSPVRWEETVEAMASFGVTRFVEVGPGRVLAGLARKIAKGASVTSVGTPADVDRYLAEAAVV